MSKERDICPECGAVQKEAADVCDLCGTQLNGQAVVSDAPGSTVAANGPEEVDADAEVEEEAESESDRLERGGFCTSCGAAYPVDARFCGSCGRKIGAAVVSASAAAQETPARARPPVPSEEAPSPKRAATDRELGRQVLLVVGAAVVLIIALFVITVVSKNDDTSGAAGGNGDLSSFTAAPLAPEVQGTVASLQDEIESLSGDARIAKQRELSNFLLSHGRWDLAGEVEAQIAEQTGEESDWVRSGNLYYDWMDGVEGDAKVVYAKRAVESYQRALQINPDNLDVRTDMAIAYMFDPENSVQAIAQTNMVLEEDSLHIQANFNRGIMLLRVNRFDEAAFQFNKVRRIIDDPSNPIYQRAESALDAIRQVGG